MANINEWSQDLEKQDKPTLIINSAYNEPAYHYATNMNFAVVSH